jgi:hypothetical protein
VKYVFSAVKSASSNGIEDIVALLE